MELIKNLLIDSMNGFSPEMIPFFILQLVVASLLGYVLEKILNKKFNDLNLKNSALLALGIALICSVAKFSVPIAIIAAAIILLLGMNKERSQNQTIGLFLVSVIGAGCGVGSVVVTFLAFIFLSAVILFLPLKSED